MTKRLVLAAISLAGCAHSAAVPAAGKVPLQLKLNPGEVRRYAVQVSAHTKALMNDVTMFDAPVTMKYTQVLETGAHDADGTTEVKQRLENLDVSAGGPMGGMIKQTAQGLGQVTIVTRVRPDGTVASMKTDGVGDNAMLQGMAKQIAHGARFNYLPRSPVGPGDTWTTEEKTPLGGMGDDRVQALVKSTLKFVAIEACGAKQCAHVESDSQTTVPEDASAEVTGGGSGHSVILIEVDSGRPWRSQGKQETKLQTSQGGQAIDITSQVSFTSELKP